MDQGSVHYGGRLSRRRMLRLPCLVLGALSATSLLQACAPAQPSPTPAPSQPTPQPAATTRPAQQPTPQPAQKAPAVSKPGSLSIILWSHFVPDFDKWLDQYVADWGAKQNVTVRVDHIPLLEIPARLGAEISAQAGHDIVMLPPRAGVALYAEHLADVTDVVEELGKPHGGWSEFAHLISNIDGQWLSYPDYGLAFPGLYRKDLYDAEGLKKPDTWEDVLNASRTLKAKGNPAGIAISHTPDANSSWGAILWSFGASWVDKDGKTIILDSPETREALRFAKALFDEGMTNEVFAWDDAANNTFLASGRGSFIHNAISALRSIEGQNKELADKIDIASTPQGPKARLVWAPGHHYGIWKFSPNIETAKAFLRDYGQQWEEAVKASKGYNMVLFKEIPRPYPVLDNDLPKYRLVVDEVKYFATAGYPGISTAPAVEVGETYIIPDMVAKVCQGTPIDEAIAWAEGEIKKIYDKWAQRGPSR